MTLLLLGRLFPLFLSPALADWFIRDLPSSTAIVLEERAPFEEPPSTTLPGMFAIVSGVDGETVGTAEPVAWNGEGIPRLITARLLLHERNRIVRVGDPAVPLDLTKPGAGMKGRVDLLQRGKRKFSSRYKPMAYYGALHGDGGILDHGETLVDPLFTIQHGLTPRVTVKTAHTGYLLGIANAGAKVEAYRDDSIVVTPSAEMIYYTKTATFTGTARGHLTFLTNTRFMNHLSGTVLFDPAGRLRESAGIGNVLSTGLEAMTEAVLDDWNRLVFGPIYNFELKTVGGFASYFWIADRLNLGIGVRTQDLSRLRLDPEKAYSPTFTVFWRL